MNVKSNSLQFIALIPLLIAGLMGCAKSSDFSDGLRARNIVGGTVSTPEFQKENGIVYLAISSTTRQTVCAGTLINRNTILTAAHCVMARPAIIRSIIVAFTTDLNLLTSSDMMRAYTRRATVHAIHESFMDPLVISNRIDLALLRLDSDAPADFKAAPLAQTQALTEPGMTLIQAGFGRTNPTTGVRDDTVGILRQVENMLILNRSENGNDIMIDEADRGSCGGDSGGPAFARTADGELILAGVNSRGTRTDTCIGVGVYVNLASHLEWIATANASPAQDPRSLAPPPPQD